MEYFLFALIFLIVSHHTQIKIQLSNLFKKRRLVIEKIKDKDLIDLIYSKTGLTLPYFTILETDQLFGQMIGIPGKPQMTLSKSLYKEFNKSESEYVVLHEVGHYKLGHSISEFIYVLFFLLIGSLVISLYRFDLLVSIFLGIVVAIIFISIARLHEYEADDYSVKRMSDPNGMITATDKFRNYWNSPNELLRILFYRGVPYEKRIENAKKEIKRRKN